MEPPCSLFGSDMRIALALIICGSVGNIQAQDCTGGAITTEESYLYGRFETRMQSASGDGIVSSFFLYNADVACNWPAVNNEIDIEMTGNLNNSVQFTTHYPNLASWTQIIPTSFDPHMAMHDYAFEWEPGIVRWFVDGDLAYTQQAELVTQLIHPMRIMMNLWAAEASSWVGVWDPSNMPASSSYEYVRYYAYTPGFGSTGTNNAFSLIWEDAFDTLNLERWDISDFGGFNGNYCTFQSSNASVNNGVLTLEITEPIDLTETLITFSVDATSLGLESGQVIYLNGGFNNWCGNCQPMNDPNGDGIWETTISLEAGIHEYVFTQTNWSNVGQPPLGSLCDVNPCDEWANYGVIVPVGSTDIITPTYCWDSCVLCGIPSCLGDLNGDNQVTVSDVLLLLADFGCNIGCSTDLDGDGSVSVSDVLILLSSFDTDC